MQSQLADALGLKYSPVAVLLTDNKPASAMQFKEDKTGCVAAMMLAAAKGRTAAFDRRTFGCPGGGTGIGFGDCYAGFPIDRLLSTGGSAVLRDGRRFEMGEGERFFANPQIADDWVRSLPYRNVPTEYVVFKPLLDVSPEESVSVIVMLVGPDQLSALVTLAGFRSGATNRVVARWGGACQSILFAHAEAEKDDPCGVIGLFDIAQRSKVERDVLSFTVPYRMFLEMESHLDESFLHTAAWWELRKRQ
jgi:uncharacterized protein (DUF169 family)